MRKPASFAVGGRQRIFPPALSGVSPDTCAQFLGVDLRFVRRHRRHSSRYPPKVRLFSSLPASRIVLQKNTWTPTEGCLLILAFGQSCSARHVIPIWIEVFSNLCSPSPGTDCSVWPSPFLRNVPCWICPDETPEKEEKGYCSQEFPKDNYGRLAKLGGSRIPHGYRLHRLSTQINSGSVA